MEEVEEEVDEEGIIEYLEQQDALLVLKVRDEIATEMGADFTFVNPSWYGDAVSLE